MLLLLIVGFLCPYVCLNGPINILCFTGLLVGLVSFRRKRFWKYLIPFSLGSLASFYAIYSLLQQNIPDKYLNIPLSIRVKIDSIPIVGDNYSQITGQILSSLPGWDHPGRIKLLLREGLDVPASGEIWDYQARLKTIHGYANPGGYNKERAYFAKGILVEGTALSGHRISSKKSFIDQMRLNIYLKIEKSLAHRRFKEIIQGLVTGLARLSVDQNTVFQNTGTSHLLAISGLHIGLVYWFSSGCCLSLFRLKSHGMMQIKATFGWMMAFLYCIIAGFSVPTQRAFVMLSVYSFAVCIKRKISNFQGYGLALAGVLCINPLVILNWGFWLSFIAVGLLMTHSLNKQSRSFWVKLGAQRALFLGLFPVTLVLFDQASLVSFFTNLWVVPWFSVITIPLSLTGVLLGLIHDKLGSGLLQMAHWSIDLTWPVLAFFSKCATFSSTSLSLNQYVLMLFSTLLALMPKGLPGKGAIVISVALILLHQKSHIPFGTARVTVLDVGQGLSTVIETRDHLVVFDTGTRWSNHLDLGAQVVIPYLKTLNKKTIDALIISHNDMDHAGGGRTIMQNYPVKHVMTSENTLDFTSTPLLCRRNQSWEYNGVKFRFLHPDNVLYKKKNNRSCVLLIDAGNKKLLLTGDIESSIEEQLVQDFGHTLESDILVVSHHGSKTSSTEPFIRAVKPQFGVISRGYLNPYHHPSDIVVERLEKNNVTLLDTVDKGAVSFVLSKDQAIRVECFRDSHRRFWNYPFKFGTG